MDVKELARLSGLAIQKTSQIISKENLKLNLPISSK